MFCGGGPTLGGVKSTSPSPHLVPRPNRACAVLCMTILTIHLIACPRDDRAPNVPPSEDVQVLGYRAKRHKGDETIHLLEVEAPFRLSWRGGMPTVALEGPWGRERLAFRRTEARDGRTLGWLPPIALPVGASATLVAAEHRFRVEIVPAEWSSVGRARIHADATTKLAALVRSSTTTLERLDAALELARMLARGGDVDGYRRVQRDRAAVAEEHGILTIASDALSAAAYYAYREHDYAAVEPLVRRSIELARRSEHIAGESRAELMRGYAAYDIGRYRGAIAAFERSARLARRTGDDAELAFAENALAVREDDLGMYDRASERIGGVASYFEAAPDRERPPYLNDRGWIRARAMVRGDLPTDWNIPRTDLEEALRLARELDMHDVELAALGNLAWLSLAAGEIEKATSYVDTLDASRETNPRYADAFADLMRARLALARGAPRDALRAAERARDLAERLAGGRPSDETWRAHFLLGRALTASEPERARAEFNLAIDALEILVRATDIHRVRASFFDERAALYDFAIEAALRAGDAAAAFETAERAHTQLVWSFAVSARRERLSLEAGAGRAQQRDAFFAARSKVERLRETTRVVPTEDLEAHRARIAKAEAEVARTFDALARDADLDVGKSPARVRAEDVQGALPENAVLIARYIRSSTGIDAIPDATVTSTRTFRITRGAITHVANPDSLAAWRALRGAASLVFVLSEADRERDFLTAVEAVSDDASVSLLPFAAALRPPDTNPSRTGALIVADPSSNLFAARSEGRAVAARIEGSTLLEGPAATREVVWPALGEAVRFHFAGHAELHPSDPWQARLELAKGGSITLADLLADPPHVTNAVLNGCRTGSARPAGRRFVLGLPDAFILAGTRTVLATFNQIDDAEARAFIEEFYAAGGAENPISAFRAVVTEQRERSSERWRSFYVMGCS